MAPRESFTSEVVILGHILELRLDRALRPEGLTARQFCVLRAIADTANVSRASLARELHISPQAVGELTRRLAASGLVERPEADPGRATAVRLTPSGTDCLKRSRAIVAETERAAVSLLDPATVEGLLAGVRGLLESLPCGSTDPA
ncbi:MAG TPA: MarR family transcriptional regulator [Pseudonocardia sp.]|nr:MarR family transcriptional regulator [Pseudonocardia sp.]